MTEAQAKPGHPAELAFATTSGEAVVAAQRPRSLAARDCVKLAERDDLLCVAWSSGRINNLNATWANSFGLGEFLR